MHDNVVMETWPNRRLLDLLKLDIPIIQALMAGSDSVPLAQSVSARHAPARVLVNHRQHAPLSD